MAGRFLIINVGVNVVLIGAVFFVGAPVASFVYGLLLIFNLPSSIRSAIAASRGEVVSRVRFLFFLVVETLVHIFGALVSTAFLALGGGTAIESALPSWSLVVFPLLWAASLVVKIAAFPKHTPNANPPGR